VVFELTTLVVNGEFMATRRQLSQNNRENEKLTRECEELTNRQQVSYAPIYFSWKWGHPCPELTTLVVTGTDCKSSCKSNYHTITTAPCHSFHLLNF
jgi:hypothetical protein